MGDTEMDTETATETATATEDMVTVVVTATTAATVVMVTGTVVAMATVAAIVEEDVATERFPGMVMLDIKRGTIYNICIYSMRFERDSRTNKYVYCPVLSLPTRKESCVCVCVFVFVYEVYSFILITYK